MSRSAIAFALLVLLQPTCMRSEAVNDWPLVGETGTVVGQADSSFASLVARLSEPGGYFDSDNLVSNELSYQHVLGAMRRLKVSGGAYIGVGPDQNYTYIAKVRPKIAYMIDVRRDNLLQHLLYNRAEYMALLFARPVPKDIASWDRRGIDQIIAYMDSVAPRRELYDSLRGVIATRVATYGIPLDARDLETIARIHGQFAAAGLNLQYESLNRPSRRNYPAYRELILERDLDGNQANYFVNEDDFQFVKSLHAKNLIVPVTGNLAGSHALRAIGRDIAARGERVSALYVSNVEFYLMREGTFDAFAASVRTLPHDSRSVIIRSYFGGGFYGSHPQSVPGYFSTQLLQTVDTFMAESARGGYATYMDLVSKHNLDLK
jgi:hypothetical protein